MIKYVSIKRKEFNIKLKGSFDIKPVISFGYLGLDDQFLSQIAKHGFTKPTPIQAQVNIKKATYFKILYSLFFLLNRQYRVLYQALI